MEVEVLVQAFFLFDNGMKWFESLIGRLQSCLKWTMSEIYVQTSTVLSLTLGFKVYLSLSDWTTCSFCIVLVSNTTNAWTVKLSNEIENLID